MLDKLTSRYTNLTFFQFGCGGVGSWLAQFMGKFLHSIAERFGVHRNFDFKYVIIDDDTVEPRNILRQNFLPINIGDYKCNAIFKFIATPLIEKRLVFITERIDTPKKIKYLIDKFFWEDFENIYIIFGCVDNIKTRRSIYSAMKKIIKLDSGYETVIYIDGGNQVNYGQVITTVMTSSSWFPTIIRNWNMIDKFPNIHRLFKNGENDESAQPSCAFFGDQSMGINLKIATEMFTVIQRILIDSIIPEPLIKTIIL